MWRSKPGGTWEIVDTGVEMTDQFAMARDVRVAVVRGTSATTPDKLFAVDLKKNAATEILDPGSSNYEDVAFGRVDRWIAPLPDGQELDGFIYYPPDFDPDETYPLIVYYYGGTSPVDRSFGGRYPKNVWAGQGYVVYVPNPSGATGYGQEFAARHVNDWGILTADEVIESTKAFLAAHDFADPARVGCIGASYGGFLTQYLITQTDIFAAAVSHAGISDITSYWGEGFWGYNYGAVALACLIAMLLVIGWELTIRWWPRRMQALAAAWPAAYVAYILLLLTNDFLFFSMGTILLATVTFAPGGSEVASAVGPSSRTEP